MPAVFPIIAVLARISFPAGSADLNGEDQQLDDTVAWAANHPGGMIVLDGHGRTARLSHDRAVVVRDELVEAGVNPYQITIAVFTDESTGVVIWGAGQ